jgi:hypothetical protein
LRLDAIILAKICDFCNIWHTMENGFLDL